MEKIKGELKKWAMNLIKQANQVFNENNSRLATPR